VAKISIQSIKPQLQTNQQMAKEMWVSPHTVKEYMRSAQVKWKVHRSAELRMLLAQWDFSEWGPKAQD
jgi:DNA-binding CsgD family transcriptional regulator